MTSYNRLFEESSIEYAETMGYVQKRKLYECVASGNLEALDQVLDEYIEGLKLLVGDDISIARNAMRYVWPQMNAYVTDKALSNQKAKDIQQKYYYELEQIGRVEGVYELCRTLSWEFAEAVWRENRENQLSPLVKRCCNYVRSHVYDDLTVAGVAEAMHFSQSYVSHKFKDELGMTLEKYIRIKKVEEAKKLLQTNMPLMDIASTLGFASQSHFTDVFKKEIGITPKQFRSMGSLKF